MNKIFVSGSVLQAIRAQAESSYPEESAGLMLGKTVQEVRIVLGVLGLENRRAGAARRTRYLIEAADLLRASEQAEASGQEVVGVFHSHPDHPARPSETDREWAWPYYSYLITSVVRGNAEQTRCWRLSQDRSGFEEETVEPPAQVGPGLEGASEERPGRKGGIV